MALIWLMSIKHALGAQGQKLSLRKNDILGLNEPHMANVYLHTKFYTLVTEVSKIWRINLNPRWRLPSF